MRTNNCCINYFILFIPYSRKDLSSWVLNLRKVYYYLVLLVRVKPFVLELWLIELMRVLLELLAQSWFRNM